MPKKISTDDVRAGTTPHIVRYVLLISFTLAVAAMVLVYMTSANP